MNKTISVERLVRMNAFGLCALVYLAGFALTLHFFATRSERTVSIKAVRLSIAQPALRAEPMPIPELKPKPESEPVPVEDADVTLEELVEKAEPRPVPRLDSPLKTDAPIAQITQEASTPVFSADQEAVEDWVLEQLNMEKYRPAVAERFGLKGVFRLKVVVDETGRIQSGEILDGNGHRVLRQAVQKVLLTIAGRKYKKPIGEPMGFEVKFEFE